MRVLVVSGLAGAGKSTALRALEDLGFYCVDNQPVPLLSALVDLVASLGVSDVAVSIDARQHEFLARFSDETRALREAGHRIEVLFLEAADEVLIRRFSQTRRRHPLAGDELTDGVARDRLALAALRDDAAVVDTSELNVHQLKAIIDQRYGRGAGGLAITLQSFGYKHGLPADSDLVFDVRFLPNPHFVPALAPMDGRQAEVSEFVLGTDEGRATVDQVESFLRFAVPRYAAEGKSYLTVSIGCTGGRHRSVAIAEALGARFAGEWDILVRHRDLHRGGADVRDAAISETESSPGGAR
jgi:RNase adapter protein RapZ